MMRSLRVIRHHMHLFLSHDITTKIFLELSSPLQSHAQVARLVVMLKKLLRRVDFVNMFPPTSGIGLQESRKAGVLKDLIPVQGIHEVSHGLVGCSRWMLVVRKNNRRRNCHSQLRGQSVIEELVI